MRRVFLWIVIYVATCTTVQAQEMQLVLPEGHTNYISDLSYSPDGKYILSASKDGTAKVWTASTGRLVYTLKGHKEALTSASFSPDGKKIISTAMDDEPALWDAVSGKQLLRLYDTFHLNRFCNAMISADGKKILTAASAAGTALLWDAETGVVSDTLNKYSMRTVVRLQKYCGNWAAKYSHDNSYIASSIESKDVTIWDARTNQQLRTLTGHTGNIESLEISKNDKYILTGARDSSYMIWDVNTGTPIERFKMQGDEQLLYAAMNPTLNYVLFASPDSGLIAWSITEKKIRKKVRNPGANVIYITFSPDGLHFATVDRERNVGLWDAAKGNFITSKKYPGITAIQFSPDGKELAVSNKAEIEILSTFNLDHIHTLGTNVFQPRLLAISPDNKYLVTSAHSSDHTMRVWNLHTGKLQTELFGHEDGMWAAYHPDGSLLFSCSTDSTIRVWDTKTWQCLSVFPGGAGPLSSIKISHTGKYFVVSSWDHTVQLWDIATLKPLLSMSTNKTVSTIEFNDNDSLLAFASSDGIFHLVDIQAKKHLGQTTLRLPPFSQDIGSLSIDFSDIGNQLLLAFGGTIRIIDLAISDTVYKEELSYSPPLLSVRFGSQPGQLIAARIDNGLFVIDTKTNERSIFGKNGSASRSGLTSWNQSGSPDQEVMLSPDKKNIAVLNDSLMLYDNASKSVINLGEAKDFMMSDKGQLLIYNDQSQIIVYTMKQHEKICRIISMNNYDDGYVTLAEDGYYRGNKNSINELSYVTGNTLINFSQLDIKYNRPDKVLRHLNKYFNDPEVAAQIPSYEKAYQKRLDKLNIDSAGISRFTVPVCEVINEAQIPLSLDSLSLVLKIRAYDSLSPLKSFNVMINEVPVYGKNGIAIQNRRGELFETEITLQLASGLNVIEPYVVNSSAFESHRKAVRVDANLIRMHMFDKYSDSLNMEPIDFIANTNPKFYFIGIGINQYADKKHNLNWSVKDIRDLALKFKSKYPGKDNFVVDTLFDKKVTRKNILTLKKKLLELRRDDIVVIAYSGHGILNADFDYYLSTYDIDFKHPEKKGLAYSDLEDLMDSINPIRKLVLIDACHSGEIDKTEMQRIAAVEQELKDKYNVTVEKKGLVPEEEGALSMNGSFKLMQELFVNAGRSTGTTIMSAAAGTQFALESGDLKNGVFTYSILELLNSRSSCTVNFLTRHVSKRVSELTQGLQQPTARSELIDRNWKLW